MSHSGDFLVYLILINSLYLSIILYSLLYLKEGKIDKKNLLKFILTTMGISIIVSYFLINYLLNEYYSSSPLKIFIIVLFFVSLLFSLYFFEKEELKWFLPVVVFILAFSFTISFFVEPLDTETIDNKYNSLESYIEDNIKGVVYNDFRNTTSYGEEHRYRFIFYILNNGSTPIDDNLQMNVDCSHYENFIIEKPNSKSDVSYFSGIIKPWVFGDNSNIVIRWNGSGIEPPLKVNGSRWAIIHFIGDVFLLQDEKFDKFGFSSYIDNVYNIDIVRFPLFVEPPSGNPEYWDVSLILEDIDMFG